MTQTPLFWTCIAFVFGAHVQVDVRRQDQLTMFEYLTRTIVVPAAG